MKVKSNGLKQSIKKLYKMYQIYHIPGIKIGCSKNAKKRVLSQGYSDFEIIEEHSSKIVAGNRELELQKIYGYRLDNVNFGKVDYESNGFKGGKKIIELYGKKHLSNCGKIGGTKSKWSDKDAYLEHMNKITTYESCSKGGKKGGKQAVLSGQLEKARINANVKVECPHCGKVGQKAGMSPWHFDKCKFKY
jgi:hypothetical protein